MSRAPVNDTSPFGRFAPGPALTRLIDVTRKASNTWLGKRTAFFLRSLAIKQIKDQPVDIQTMGANMRLYPSNNICEKRMLFTPQYFDAPERALLKSRVTEDFVFLDIGANVGGYALYVAGITGPRARILAFEPQPEIFERLIYNIRQNPFAKVKALDCALADRDGEVTLFVAPANKGETSMRILHSTTEAKPIQVPCKALATLVQEEGFTRIDAAKLDVEGAEDLILEPFFRTAPEALWPKLLLLEHAPERWAIDLFGLILSKGYRQVQRSRQNIAFERD